MKKEKSCPFCGSRNLSKELLQPLWGGGEKEMHIICDECACAAPHYIWNDRKAGEPDAASRRRNGYIAGELSTD